MQIDFTRQADQDFKFFIRSGNKQILKRINSLIKSINEAPFYGIGKPEPLQHQLSGLWSRRINDEHRLIYEVQKDRILIHSFRGHYEEL